MGKPSKRAVMKAIKGSGHIMSTVAKRLGIDWSTARNYVNKWEETKEAWISEREINLDAAETGLLQSIRQDKDLASIKWYLTKHGKHRGYGNETKHEIGGSGLNVILTHTQADIDALDAEDDEDE